MTTTAKLAANRRNGAKSRGPRTLAGKARSSRNATRHGLRAEAVVLPVVENAKDFEHHHQAVLADLAPEGAVELELAERVAVLMWRLRRVVRFESAELAEAQHEAEHEAVQTLRNAAGFGRMEALDVPADQEEGRWVVEEHTKLVQLVDTIAELPDDAEAFGGGDVVTMAADVAGIDLDELDVSLPGVEDETPWESIPWTAGPVRVALDAVAEAAEEPTTVLELLAEVRFKARSDLDKSTKRLAELEAAVRARRGRGLILPNDMPDRVARYEGHLERSLYRTLHELERRQASRRGAPPPLAVDLDVTVGRRREPPEGAIEVVDVS